MVLKSIGVISCGKLLGVLYALMGIILGGIFSLMAVAGFAAGNQPGQDAAAGAMLGAGAIIILPIMYGIMGFIGGIIMAALYNLVAGLIGGIEMEFAASGDTIGSQTPADW